MSRIAASEKVMKHVFGEQNFSQFVREQSEGEAAWLNCFGANVYIDDSDKRVMPSPVTYDPNTNSPIYVWIVCGHHQGEAEETIAKIEEGKKYIDSLKQYRVRASTKKEKTGYRALIVREHWEKRARKWIGKKELYISIGVFKNRDDSYSLARPAAKEVAISFLHELYPVKWYEST